MEPVVEEPDTARVTSHHSCVIPLIYKNEQWHTRLVLYRKKNKGRTITLEWRMIGGGSIGASDGAISTAVREMWQEAALIAQDPIRDSFSLVFSNDQPDVENWRGIHQKMIFICGKFSEDPDHNFSEPDIEGFLDIPFIDMFRHLESNTPLPQGRRISSIFHRVGLRVVAVQLAELGLSDEIAQFVEEFRWKESLEDHIRKLGRGGSGFGSRWTKPTFSKKDEGETEVPLITIEAQSKSESKDEILQPNKRKVKDEKKIKEDEDLVSFLRRTRKRDNPRL